MDHRIVLGSGDEARLEAFLAPRAATSMFLRGNAHLAGLIDRGQTYQGTSRLTTPRPG